MAGDVPPSNIKMALKILSATGYGPIEKELYSIDGCIVIGTVTERQDAYDFCITHKPDIMVISDYLPGEEKMIPFLLRFHSKYPDTRIIYLAQELNAKNTAMIDALGSLVLNGIYDIIHERNISIELIEDIINHPKSERSMSYLTERILGVESTVADNGFSYESSDSKEKKFDGISNLYVVSSVKPGSGKSFVAANLAAACAAYGNKKIALIEADLQNLSIGTLLKMEEDEKNLMTALKAIDSIMQEGKVAVGIDDTKVANEKILNCMKPYKGCKNLDVLVGSQLTFSDVNGDYISANGFIYLAEILSRHYDYVIVDTNSSLLHLSTLPLLKRARKCFYVLNIDFNNVRNNIKYQSVFEDIDVKDKLIYILNQTIENGSGLPESVKTQEEELLFTEHMVKEKYFDIAIEIPALSRNVFLNRLYEGRPVVLDEDVPYTKDAKDAFLNLANMITPIESSPDYIKSLSGEEAEPIPEEEKKGLFGFLKNRKSAKSEKQEK